jgi:ribonuclease BN (tRNA processing enzyme)
MKLHLLGVSGPFPESDGATSGYLLEVGEDLIQFDLGSGVLARLTALMPPEDLTALFLSHWHFDHTADLTVLMYRLEALGRSLQVFAPVDESSAMRKIVSAASCFSLTDVSPGQVIALEGGCTVAVGEARHPVPAVGFRVEQDGRVFGYTGDTNTLPSLSEFYRGCDLLLADGLFPAENWSEGKPHLSAALAAALAKEAGAERLLLTHLNPFFSPRQLLREAQAVHPHVTLASAGAVLDL